MQNVITKANRELMYLELLVAAFYFLQEKGVKLNAGSSQWWT
jgi:hypothetical protein